MIAATVVTSLFVVVAAITWLSSRADASQTRCDQLARHIRHQLESPPTGRTGRRTPGTGVQH